MTPVTSFANDNSKPHFSQEEIGKKRYSRHGASSQGGSVAVDRIAAALCRVAELERTLANRPLPGSRRTGADRQRQGNGFQAPLDA